MPFDMNVTRLTGTTLDTVHRRLWKHAQDASIVDPSMVWMVLDDEVVPTEQPPSGRFITVRLPSLIWQYGDVFIGGGDVGKFHLVGQTRISLWLRNELDLYGQVQLAVAEAVAPPPRGNKLLGRLIRHFHETDLLDATDGDAILQRPMKFISYDPPAPGARDWRAFRIVFELEFIWDLSQETEP